MRQLVFRIDSEIRLAQDRVFSLILSKTLEEANNKWIGSTSRFVQLRTALLSEKQDLLAQLKHRLGHPHYSSELALLNKKVDQVVQDINSYMTEMNDQLYFELSKTAISFLDQLEFVVIAFTGLLDGMVMIQNVEVPRKYF